MKLAHRLEHVQPSPTLTLNTRVKALLASGHDVCGFAAGEPDFDTPEYIKEAAIDALKKGFTKYTASAGIPELRSAIAAKLQQDNGLSYDPSQIVVGCGAKHVLYNCFQALLSKGDEVIVFSPYWVSYPDMVRLADGVPVIIPTRVEDGYAPSAKLLQQALTSRTKVVILNSPSNPTGAVLSKGALAELGQVLAGHDCLIVTDDIYEKLIYSGDPFVNIANAAPALKDRTLVVNGFSKAYSMTGWRLGYGAGPKDLIDAMQKVQDQSTSNAVSFAQKAAVVALQRPSAELDVMVKAFKTRRDFMVGRLNALNGVKCRLPEGAFYAFADFNAWLGRSFNGQKITGSAQLSDLLLDQVKVAAVAGAPFGAEGHLRFSFATADAVIEKGMQRLEEFSRQLT